VAGLGFVVFEFYKKVMVLYGKGQGVNGNVAGAYNKLFTNSL